jgi:hypothetical protein
MSSSTPIDFDQFLVLASAPRRVIDKPSGKKNGWLGGLICVLYSLICVALLATVIVVEVTDRTGFIGQGRVVGHDKEGEGDEVKYHLTVAYKVNGAEVTKRFNLDEWELAKIPDGNDIGLRYLPSLPQVENFTVRIADPRIARGPGTFLGGVVAVWILGGLFLLIYAIMQAARKKEILRCGLPTKGKVEKKEEVDGESTEYKVTYQFNDEAGTTFTATDEIGKEYFASIQPGDEVVVFYLPSNPKKSVIYNYCQFMISR